MKTQKQTYFKHGNLKKLVEEYKYILGEEIKLKDDTCT